jgi:hypothetical protein
VNVRGGVPPSKSPLGTLQLTIAFWVKGYGNIFKVVRTHHRLFGAFINQNDQKLHGCYDETFQSPCFQIYQIQGNIWNHVILQIYEYTQDMNLRARFNLYINGTYKGD